MRTPGFTFLLLMSVGFLAPFCAWGETIELVTYYPAPGGQEVDTPRLHADAATIGDPYSLTNPAALPNGTLLVAGPVGIGTANPGVALHVDTPLGFGLMVSSPGLAKNVILGTNNGGNAPFVQVSQEINNAARTWQMAVYPDNRFTIVQPGGADRLTILPAGNVGIGTTSPTVRLDVAEGKSALRLGHAYLSSYEPGWALLAYNGWTDSTIPFAPGFPYWQIPDATKRTTLVALSETTIEFWQTQTAGQKDWQQRAWMDANGMFGFSASIRILPGAGQGKVLTSDAAGVASWQAGGATPDFDSGWFAVSINERYVFNHSLGQIPARVDMQFSPNASGSPAYIVGMMNHSWFNGYNVEMNSAQFKIFTGTYSVCVYRGDGSGYPGAAPNSGYYRFRAWK